MVTVSLNVLRKRGNVIGTKRKIQINVNVMENNHLSEKQSCLRLVSTENEAREIASKSASIFINCLDKKIN